MRRAAKKANVRVDNALVPLNVEAFVSNSLP